MGETSDRARPAFERLVAMLDYPMFVVTTAVADARAGCLVGFATQASIDPPRFVVCLSRANRTLRVVEQGATLLGVHFLRDTDKQLAELFGGRTGDEIDKFAACRWHAGAGGTPILDECPNWFVGRICERFELGDHVAFSLQPVDAAQEQDGEDFSFHRARVIDPGHDA